MRSLVESDLTDKKLNEYFKR